MTSDDLWPLVTIVSCPAQEHKSINIVIAAKVKRSGFFIFQSSYFPAVTVFVVFL